MIIVSLSFSVLLGADQAWSGALVAAGTVCLGEAGRSSGDPKHAVCRRHARPGRRLQGNHTLSLGLCYQCGERYF